MLKHLWLLSIAFVPVAHARSASYPGVWSINKNFSSLHKAFDKAYQTCHPGDRILFSSHSTGLVMPACDPDKPFNTVEFRVIRTFPGPSAMIAKPTLKNAPAHL